MGKLSVSAGKSQTHREKGWVVQGTDSRIQQTKKKKKEEEHHREVSEKEC